MEFKTEKQIFNEMVDEGVETGLLEYVDADLINKIKDGVYTENQYLLDLNTHSIPLSALENKAAEIYNDINIATASGQALDQYGNLLNVARSPSKPALVTLNITLAASSETDITIPSNTKVILSEVTGDEYYVTSEDINISSGVTTATGTAESVIYGYRTALPIGAVDN